MDDDNPAKHILVKSADEFAAMLVRRGYQLEEHRDSAGLMYHVKVGNKEHITQYSFDEHAFLYCSVAEVARRLDAVLIDGKRTGRRHRQCAQCGMPLLFYGKYLYEEGNCLKWYMCQKVGTQSPYEDQLERCPGCGIEFGYPPPIKAVSDISDAQPG